MDEITWDFILPIKRREAEEKTEQFEQYSP